MSAIAVASAAVAHQVAANASDDTKQHFRFLYEEYLKSVQAGKPFICVPHVVGQQIGTAALEGIAHRFCIMVQEDVQIVFHPLAVAYLIGAVGNLPYTPVSTIYIAEYRPQIMIPTHEQPVRGFHPRKDQKSAHGFILYWKWRQAALKVDKPNLTAAEISKAVSELWNHESDFAKNHFKTLAEQLRKSRRVTLLRGGAATTSSTQNAVVQQPLPSAEPMVLSDPTNEAFAQTLPLLDPMIQENDVLVGRLTAH